MGPREASLRSLGLSRAPALPPALSPALAPAPAPVPAPVLFPARTAALPDDADLARRPLIPQVELLLPDLFAQGQVQGAPHTCPRPPTRQARRTASLRVSG